MSKGKLVVGEEAPVTGNRADEATLLEEAEKAAKAEEAKRRLPAPQGDDVPEWAIMPPNMVVPPGRQVVFMRFPAHLTAVPTKGERQCILWTLSDSDEKNAAARCNGNAMRAAAEYSKGMIRAIDGVRVDWGRARGPGAPDEFWEEIGPKGRNLLQHVYSQLHMATREELDSFFEHCVAVRTAG